MDRSFEKLDQAFDRMKTHLLQRIAENRVAWTVANPHLTVHRAFATVIGDYSIQFPYSAMSNALEKWMTAHPGGVREEELKVWKKTLTPLAVVPVDKGPGDGVIM